jgi:hypothetical protein
MHRLAALAIAIGAVTACNPFKRKHAVEIENSAVPVSSRWNATLATPPGLAGAVQVRGNAWMAPADNHTRVHIDIANAAPGGVHPWHIHVGQCGANGQIFGPASAYKSLTVQSNGTASADADLPMQMPTNGQYYVNVHASANNMGTIIACGNLAPPLQ